MKTVILILAMIVAAPAFGSDGTCALSDGSADQTRPVAVFFPHQLSGSFKERKAELQTRLASFHQRGLVEVINDSLSVTGQTAVLCVSAMAAKDALADLLQSQGFVQIEDRVLDPGTSGMTVSN